MGPIQLIENELAALVIVDVQVKMLTAIGSDNPERIVERITKLIRAALLFDIPIIFTEQYPAGLGETDSRLKAVLPEGLNPLIKTTCSCWRDVAFKASLQETGREHVIVAGLEMHVCIQQTVLDLMSVDFIPFVPIDACGSRYAEDANTAIERMRAAGAEITTVESLLFELVARCDHPKFKEFLKIVK